MQFTPPLIEARLVRRYKRFLCDIRLADGTQLTAHCPNPGSMLGLVHEEGRCWLSHSDDPKRKYAYRLELVEVPGPGAKVIVGVHAALANRLVEEAIAQGALGAEIAGGTLKREVAYGKNSRIDFLHEAEDGTKTYIEVKNVHLMREAGLAEFPDCVTARGTRHLGELAAMVEAGHRALQVYLIQWPGAERFRPAHDIDPAYASAARDALQRGVGFLALGCAISSRAITVTGPVPVTI